MSAATGVFVHESSYVDEGATIGAGTKVWHFCHVMPGAVIGRDCSLGQNTVVMNRVRVGDHRILYQVKGKILLVLIVRIGHRRDVYRRIGG